MPAGEYTCVLSLRDGYLLVWSTCGYFDKRKPVFVARNLGHSAAIDTAQGVLYDVRVAERLPRRLHGVPSPVGAARGTEAARPQDNARRREGPRRADEKQCRTYL